MATILNALNLSNQFNNISNRINNISLAATKTKNVFNTLNVTMDHTASVNFGSVNQSIAALDKSVQKVAATLERADMQQINLNQDMKAGQGAAGKLSGMLSKIDVAQVAMSAVQTSDKMIQTRAKLNTTNDGSQTTKELENKVFASAQRSRTGYFDMASAVTTMGANTQTFKTSDETIAFAEQVNKIFKIDGASGERQSTAIMQLSQAMADGAVKAEELNSILEVSPSLGRSIETAMGLAEGSILSYAEQGSLTASAVKNSVFQMAEDTNTAFSATPMTWGDVLNAAINGVMKVSRPLLDFINLLANSWSILGPIVMGVVAAIVAYNAVMGVAWLETVKNAAAIAWKTICSWAETAAIIAMTLASEGLNAALALCPITWIIIAIIALIAIFYAVIAAINKFTGSSLSATGMIMGAFYVLGAFLYNTVIVPLYNAFAMIANFLGNVFNNPIGAVKVAFYDMAIDILGYIEKLASAIETIINKIPGVKVNITSGLDSFKEKLEKAQEKVKDESGWVEYVKKLDYKGYTDAWDKGNKMGAGLQNKVTDLFSQDNSIPDSLNQTADNTGKMANTMEMSGEDLKYLRDVAEREVINRFTTADLNVTMQTTANVNSDLDIDGIISQLEDKTYEMLVSTAEGV
ncbi:tape measure protein [Sinanaerobacter sp. ZZT-01]|uniref:tape measure protein n=1 Tax=Sinanaerobacter sp. ZZT-01 TaxID=3111540 RepID=UPI002D78F1B4|nr:tape measure protein [Sinanaerobacter sp. ZZT-01]WRR94089.1 tape measure protein [Sinanaerobacter sp. ZZT-01]